MAEEQSPPEVAPDEAFAQTADQMGIIEEFCSQNYPDNQDQCEVMVADRLRGEPTEPPTPEPNPEPDVVDEVIMGEAAHEDHGFETLVADCVGGRGFLGWTRPDMGSCMRVVAKHERAKHQ